MGGNTESKSAMGAGGVVGAIGGAMKVKAAIAGAAKVAAGT